MVVHMTKLQLVEPESPESGRVDYVENPRGLSTAQVFHEVGRTPVAPGTDGLIGVAAIAVRRGWRIRTMGLRDPERRSRRDPYPRLRGDLIDFLRDEDEESALELILQHSPVPPLIESVTLLDPTTKAQFRISNSGMVHSASRRLEKGAVARLLSLIGDWVVSRREQ